MFCVSIAFIHKSKPLIGVIYAPFTNQFFSSCAGRGAFYNETQRLPLVRNLIPPMPAKAPSGCIFSCEWGKDSRDYGPAAIPHVLSFLDSVALFPSAMVQRV